MVVGTLQQVPSRGRISIMKIQNFTVTKRHSVIKLSYGFLLMMIGTILAAINPIHIITNYFLEMREGSFLYNMWENPTYELFSEIWVYNYTNVDNYLSGAEKVMRIKEVGPFTYKEVRTNENMRIDKERGVLTMNPHMRLEFLREESIDDVENINLIVPNVPLIAISTLVADKLGYLPNAGFYYSMQALGSNVFKNLNAKQYFWGYHDPIVSLANGILPGWIDFKKIGLLDRLYADRNDTAEVELQDLSRRYSLNSWDNTTGLIEQGFTEWNSSTLCNQIKGTYEGIMLPANFPKGRSITVFRKQACRSFPFNYVGEHTSAYGFNSYKYIMDRTAFSRSSPYDCKRPTNDLPEGFIDIGQCYYGFPIVITKPHFLDVDPVQMSYFEGMSPSYENHSSFYELEPTLGVPIQFAIKVQINLAVRMSSGNPITAPVKDKILPLIWFTLSCRAPPPEIVTLLKLRLIIGPPLYITSVIILFIAGFVLGAQGFYRMWKPRYKIIPPSDPPAPIIRRKSQERRRSSVHENIAFKDDDEMAKEAVSLLAINEEEGDFVELLICEDDEFED